MCCLIKCFGKKLSGWHKNRKVFSGISPSANICSLCAWQASLPIFERQMRTHSARGLCKKGCYSLNARFVQRESYSFMCAGGGSSYESPEQKTPPFLGGTKIARYSREFRLWRIFARSAPGKQACRSSSGKCEPIARRDKYKKVAKA